MSATLFSASYAGVSGLDLETELKQTRTSGHDAIESDVARVRDEARIAGTTPALPRETPRSADYAVELHGVGKRYGERTVLSDFSLSIERGSFVAIVGRSGCGKSTLLRLVAELETPSTGVLKKHDAGGAPLDTRIMFQDARLLPWKTVLQNVMLGLSRGARDDARAVLAEVGLAGRANDWPAQLSGGQRQRVALARALVHRPQLLLLDEPLGALDALTRIEMHALIERLWREHRFTALLVTHDVHEAVALGDRILLIEEGRIALDQPVPLARPRARASSAFAALEEHVLHRVLKSTPDDNAPPFDPFHDARSAGISAPSTRSARPADVRWAI
ncbi:ATP-binding cassette domain-containing protein [Paraburkholderia gardini]|uniref:Vitamin B12 import ATP-binding protein BtuD n=1 Tax=Paraburkholderia gardini TaxID=2823469 RepID=A0ABN7QHY7_9BURK|nr:ATP-binding cassette domain-containing protein [Paraburkholderia gardini]CAG4888251.1 Vitamin B12 import ATP-binding protein BtuD [Paraburkholderia gardini]